MTRSTTGISATPAKPADCIRSMADWDAFIEAGIARHRRGRFRVRLVDEAGEPLAGQPVRLELARHDFTFGVCPNGHVSLCNDWACGSGPEADRYWDWIGELFNATTLWWGWRVLEPQPGRHAFDEPCEGTYVHRQTNPATGKPCWTERPRQYGAWEAMLERARGLGHTLAGHALLYPRGDVAPKWIEQLSAAEARRHLEATVRATVRRYRDEVRVWHPVNENCPGLQRVGPLEVDEGEVYRWVREEAPDAELVNNGGYEIEPDFYAQSLERAALQGVTIDTLGIRGYHELYYADDLAGFRRRWNHFHHLEERYGKGLRYTEIGANSKVARDGLHDPSLFLSGSAMHEGIVAVESRDGGLPDLSEATQAEFLVRMYKLVFAHPAMRECSYWDLHDRFTWNRVEGGLIRADGQPKLAYGALRRLFREEWHTVAEGITGPDGEFGFSGYFGEYACQAGFDGFPCARIALLRKDHPGRFEREVRLEIAAPAAPVA